MVLLNFEALKFELFSIVSDLYKMVCPENSTALNISIPVVMIPKSGGDTLNNSIASGKRGKFTVPNSVFSRMWIVVGYICIYIMPRH